MSSPFFFKPVFVQAANVLRRQSIKPPIYIDQAADL